MIIAGVIRMLCDYNICSIMIMIVDSFSWMYQTINHIDEDATRSDSRKTKEMAIISIHHYYHWHHQRITGE